jgi:hypothetical protein
VITVPPGTYLLTLVGTGEDAAATGDLDVTADVEIQGAGAATTIVDGNSTDRVFDFDPAAAGVTADLSGVTVRNGAQVAEGGGVRNAGTLTIADSTLTSNHVTSLSTARGGGIRSSGALTVIGSSVVDNVAEQLATGGFGGFAQGGGIYSDAPATIIATTVDGNTAKGSISFPPADISGGGIHATELLSVDASAVTNNTADAPAFSMKDAFGGGIRANTVVLTNSTISGNLIRGKSFPTPFTQGGGVFAGTASASNCTFADNEKELVPDVIFPAGIAGGTLTFRNTIVADRCDDFPFPPGAVTGDAYNLERGNTCGFSGADLINTDPLLGPLQHNGGPTSTHALLAMSPAREAGSPAVPGSGGTACQADDQRGVTRPQLARCDIGSVEMGPCPLAPLAGCDTPGKSLLLIKDRDADGAGAKDKLIWKWLRGPAGAQADFGDPSAATAYTLCVYSGAATAIETFIPGGDTCGGVPCWRTIGSKGYRRSDPAGGVGGLSKVILKASASSTIIIKGKGANLDLDADTLPFGGALMMQLSNSANANCWQSSFPLAAVNADTETLFMATTP